VPEDFPDEYLDEVLELRKTKAEHLLKLSKIAKGSGAVLFRFVLACAEYKMKKSILAHT